MYLHALTGLEETEPIHDVTLIVDESTSAPSGDTVNVVPETVEDLTLVGTSVEAEEIPSAVVPSNDKPADSKSPKSPSNRKVSPVKVASHRPSTNTKTSTDKPKSSQQKPTSSSKKTEKSKDTEKAVIKGTSLNSTQQAK